VRVDVEGEERERGERRWPHDGHVVGGGDGRRVATLVPAEDSMCGTPSVSTRSRTASFSPRMLFT
jgi:hypothetical protein